MEVDLALFRCRAQAGVGEIDAPVGPAHHVVRAVQALALPTVGDDGGRAVILLPGHLPVVPIAHDYPALQVKGQAVGSSAILPDHFGFTAGCSR